MATPQKTIIKGDIDNPKTRNLIKNIMMKNNTSEEPPLSIRKMESQQTDVIQEFLRVKRIEGDLPTLE